MKMKNTALLTVAMLAMTACSQSATDSVLSSSKAVSQSADFQKNALVSFKLVDAPNRDLKSVVVDVDHMEILLAGQGKAGRLQIAKVLGSVDLLTLQNGVSLPLQDVLVPHGLQIQQIRLILKSAGHFAVKGDDSVCELKTPSAQKTGVKIILTNKFNFEAGNKYDIVVDFDAKSSVVVQGNGGCLLKPVLKLKSATKAPIIVPPAPDISSDDGSTTGDSSGGTSGDPSDDSGTVVTGPGEVIITEPEVNDPVDDGWDYTPVQDGAYPVLTEGQLDTLL